MKIEINEINIKKIPCKGFIRAFVRISIGDYMYFDSPITDIKNAKAILNNLRNNVLK